MSAEPPCCSSIQAIAQVLMQKGHTIPTHEVLEPANLELK